MCSMGLCRCGCQVHVAPTVQPGKVGPCSALGLLGAEVLTQAMQASQLWHSALMCVVYISAAADIDGFCDLQRQIFFYVCLNCSMQP